jgi:hypothetical protein
MGTMTTEIQPTRLEDYIKELLPGAHGHQIKAIATFVATILDKQSGCQAELARTQGNQEAAVKRLSRLLHNERIRPKDFAESKPRVTGCWVRTGEGYNPYAAASLCLGQEFGWSKKSNSVGMRSR